MKAHQQLVDEVLEMHLSKPATTKIVTDKMMGITGFTRVKWLVIRLIRRIRKHFRYYRVELFFKILSS